MLRRLVPLIALASLAAAQDLYDDTVLRKIELTFKQANWWSDLKTNKGNGQYFKADMVVEGVSYRDVGVRLRGKSSFGAPNKKKPFKIKTDAFVDGQELMGYDSIRLNNGYFDPSWVRETVMSRLVRDYMPIEKRAYTVLEINGVSWGLYIMEQQKDAEWMDENFASNDGNRYGSVLGGAFGWLGKNAGSYKNQYDLKNDDPIGPWANFIRGADVVNNTPVGPQLTEAMLPVINVDSLLWFIASDNLFGNNDSYAGNANNWYVVHDTHHGRLEFVNHDLNLTFGTWDGFGPKFEPTHGFSVSSRPLTYRVMQDNDTKREYFAHLRTLNDEVFTWDVVGPLVAQYQALIDAEVQADPKKLYTYQQFLDNVTQDVDVGFWIADAIQPYVEKRHNYLATHPLLDRPLVEVSDVIHLPTTPDPSREVTVRVTVTGAVSPKKMELRWRTVGAFERVLLKDNGSSGDGAAGDLVFGAVLPGQPAGQRVEYYVVTTAAGGNAKTFFPSKGEWAPASFVVGFGGVGVRVTEYMYSGAGDEFLELTNTSSAPVDLTGWSMDDASGTAGVFDLSTLGVLAAGESALVTDGDAATFSADWGLGAGVKVLGGNQVAKLGRDDAIYLFDAGGDVQDRLIYGDQDFPGSPRAKGAGAWPCAEALGQDDPFAWTLALGGDVQGSWVSVGGDLGSPGTWVVDPCPTFGQNYCASTANSTGAEALLSASGSLVVAENDLSFFAAPLPAGQLGYLMMSDTQGNLPAFGGGQGVLCLGSPLVRFSESLKGTGAGDFVAFKVDLNDLPQGTVVLPGQTWNFQFWYRDVNPGLTSNTSNGLALTFE
jgi:CotH kinase protein/Lamin Tail Domain